MADLVDRFRLVRARRRWMRAPSPWRQSGAFGLVLALLAIAVVVVAILERRGSVRDAEIVEYAAARRTDPVTLVLELARTRPVVVLGDVAGAPGPKRLAAEVIAALAAGPGLDYVAIEVGSDLQPVIDRYLDAAAEDASALVSQSRSTGGGGAASTFLGIYRQVRQLNVELGADRRIRIIAIDSPDWPPVAAVAPSRLLPLFAARDAWMMERLMDRIFERDETARVLVFVDGLRALNASLRLAASRAASADMPLLARRLRSALPGRVAAVIVDSPATASGTAWVGYRGSRLDRLLRTAAAGSPLAIPLRPALPVTTGDITVTGPPGLDIGLSPAGAPLSDLADGYVRLPN
jgi:hypothetical protein